ncbi:MAG: D-sedoheptulose 7-phosphate isomerase [Candidatus Paracaedimonas acanthamoebae]|uniref:Phosphoheptose isomerase n=1 Tax=Candidatus Paracaedimonas acanthamoebae TaxID=244581 RepID=A0A8J7PZN8_9PROT|nr:D-sedoheptulose 7-phosphate isomerase [Candidatus Paracaedimonas acanthamoebae]
MTLIATSWDAFFQDEFKEHLKVAEETQGSLQNQFVTLVELAIEALQKGGKIIFFGNGGSAADSQHLATELTVRYRKNRAALAALALTTDSSALTAIGNDFGFDHLFERQLEALAKPNDLVIGITTSGKSPNVILAFKRAQALGLKTVAFTGGTGGELPGMVDLMLCVPSFTTSRIQEMHITLGQMLCGALEDFFADAQGS